MVPPIQPTTPANQQNEIRSRRLNPDIADSPIPIMPTTPNWSRIPFASPNVISQEAVNLLTNKLYRSDNDAWTPNTNDFVSSSPTSTDRATANYEADMEHFCAPVVHPVTGKTISNYKALARDPVTQETWTTALGKEFGNIAQGDSKTGEKGTNCVFIMTHDQIRAIPKDRVVTYARIVVDFRPQKEDPNRVRITTGGNLTQYPGELITRTADLTTSKVLWNSVVSTEGAKYMGIDVNSFYLCTPLD